MAKTFQILTLNKIAAVGLSRFPAARYVTGTEIAEPDAILVRSHNMLEMHIPKTVLAIARAGAGTNNVPVKKMSERGVPVFNAPGANANAVKELVITGMLLASRNIVPALHFTASLHGDDATLHKLVEEGKKHYAGTELRGRTLGIVGLGAIGRLVADAAIGLGMNVIGFDPEITVDAAWSLPSQVKKANSVEDLLKHSDFVSLHVPLLDATRDLINEKRVAAMKAGSVLLNFSRDAIVDEDAILAGLASKHVRCYVCDFPTSKNAEQSRRDRAAASGRFHAGSRRQLRGDGGGPAARLPGARQRGQHGEFPECQHAARIGFPPGDRQQPTCRTCWGRFPPRWRPRASTSTT